MTFWNISTLKCRLQNGLSETESFGYVLASSLLLAAFQMVEPPAVGGWELCGSTLNLAIVALGTIASYRANGAATGCRFLERFVALSLVVGFRYAVLVVVPMGTTVYATIELLGDVGEEWTLADLLIAATFSAGYYQRIVHHMASLNLGHGTGAT